MDTGISIFVHDQISLHNHPLLPDTFACWQPMGLTQLGSSSLNLECQIPVSFAKYELSPKFVESNYPARLDPLLGDSLLVSEEAVSISLLQVTDSLKSFLGQPNYIDSLKLSFGSGWQTTKATAILTDLSQAKNLPQLKIVSGQELQSQGAFSQQTNTIYLAQKFIEQNPINAIAQVLTEELGHYIDSQLNTVDTPGDEGELFAAIVDGVELTSAQIQAITLEDDHKIVTINGQTLLVEQSVNEIVGTGGRDILTGTPLSDRIIGGFGADVITGGSGADTFVYQNIRDAGDIIKDFELRQDVIDVSQVLSSFGYGGFNPIADGYIQFGTYADGTVILLDSDGKGPLSARPYIYVEKVTPNDLSSYTKHFIPNPGEPPQIQAGLVNDTGASASDRLTFDPTISAKVTATSNLISLKAGLNNQAVTVNIFDTLQPDGSFNLTTARLKQINGGSLNDGAYTLKLQATDNKGNISSVYSFNFVLDTTAPILNLQLDPNFDSAPVGDLQTSFEKVNLVGATEANLTVSLQQTGVSSTSNNLGQFTFTNISLTQGSNLFTVVAKDLAGNQGYFSQTFQRLVQPINTAPTNLSLNPASSAENVPDNNIIGTFTTTDIDVADTHTYSLVNGEGDTDNTAFVIVDSQLKIKKSPDFETKSAYSIRVRTTDAGGLFFDKAFNITITNVNEAPTALNLSNEAIAENVVANSIIGTFTTTEPDVGDTHTYSFVSGEGDTDNTAFTILGNELRIKQSPNFEVKSNYSIRVRTTDAGGLFFDKAFNITITNVNEAPIIEAIANQNINEQTPFAFTIKATDPESDPLTYTLDSSVPSGVNLDSTTGLLTWTPLETQGPGSYPITIRVTDGKLADFRTFTINVAEVNTAPVLANIGNKTITLGETLSFIVTANDSDSPANSLSFFIDDGAPTTTKLDTIKGTFAWTPTTVGIYPITIRVKDNGNPVLEDFETIQIQVIAPNLPPTDITLNPATISENVTSGSVVGTLNTVDPNGNDNFTYALVSGIGDSNNNQFIIDGNQVKLKFSPDFETKSTYTIRVKTTDSTGLSLEKALTINIADVNESPTNIILSNAAIAENSANNTLIGTFSSIDPDVADSFTYSLVNDAGGRFAIASGTNQIIVANSSLLNFEQANSHTIRVKTTDKGGLSFEKNLTISITNINEAPFFTSTPINNGEVGSPYQYLITTGDPENDSRILSATNLPSWLTLSNNQNGTAVLSGNPGIGNAGIYTIPLVVTDAGGLSNTQTFLLSVGAVLRERTNFSPELTTNLLISQQPQILSFKVVPSFDLGDTDSIKDAFEVALVDSQGNSLVHTITSNRDSFFNITEGLNPATAAGTNYDPITQTVKVNLTGITPNTNGRLVFRLVNNDSDIASYVSIKEINLNDAPPGTLAPLSSVGDTPFLSSSLNINKVEDVTPSIQLQYQRTSFNEETKLLYADVEVKNIGSYGINAPLVVVVKNISDPSVQLRNIDGYTPDGLPYYNFSELIPGGKLNPQQVSSDRSFAFFNPSQVQFTYDVAVLSVLNQNPVIQTQPVLEVIGGQPYKYDVNATDPDQDPLTYQLLVAPQGLGINADTGLIEWNTNVANIGNHNISIRVSDGLGGVTQQTYTLAVIDRPPNRPPIFTSTPVVDAAINQPYKYDADAIDPDQDPLTYSLVLGPDGMKVNPTTGVVEWTPPPVLTLGDTVIGRISIPGDVDEFTITGVAGQRLYIDPLQSSGDYYRWQFKVYSPSGLLVNDSRLDDNKLLNLAENGNYRIVLRTDGDMVGTYGFRVIDQNLVPIVPLDTVIQDKLSPGSQDQLYRFTGSQGQKLFFDKLSDDGNLDWVLYNASNQVVTYNGNFDDIEIDLPVAGEYTLAVRGREAFTSSVNYSFSIITPEIVTTPLNLGSVITGAIAEKGEQDHYTFIAKAGQQLWYDALDGDRLTVNIYDPQGRNIGLYNRDSRSDTGVDYLALTVDGTYKLVIDGDGETTGNYKFRLLDRDAASTVDLDKDIIGTIDQNGLGSTLYRFNITGGSKYLYFDTQAGSSPNQWLVYKPNGQYITGTSINNDQEFFLDIGEYLLVMQGNGAADTNYKVRIITPELTTAALTIGNTVSSNISEKGEQDTYTFTGTAGQQLFYDALASDYLQVRLYDPTGREIFNRDSRYDVGTDGGLVLSVNGTYKVVVDGNGEGTGNYSFRFLDRATAPLVNLDTDITGTLDNSIGSKLYRFNITGGSKYLYIDGQTGSSANQWLVYKPNGEYVTSTSINNDREFSLDTGEYLLVMQGNGGSDLNYKVRIITPELTTAALTIGNTVSGNISEKGEQDTYTFTGTAGQQLFYDALASDYLQVRLYDPTGREIFNRDSRYDVGTDGGLVLSVNGTYKVVVDGNGEGTGNYSFRFLDRATAPLVNLDTDITGTLDNSIGSKLYRFNITGGSKRLNFDSQAGVYLNSWILYAQNGQYVNSNSLSGDRELTLASGEYLLVIQGNGASDRNYNLQIKTLQTFTPTPLNDATLTLGNTVSGTISQAGGQKSYSFTGTAGQQLFYDALASDYLQVRLYDPTGREIFNRDSRYDLGTDSGLVLSTNGTYRVVVDSYGTATGNYNFRFLDKAAAPVVNLDTDITGTLDNSIGSRLYRFNITDGSKYLYIDGQAGTYYNNWIIYAPNGQYITSTYIYDDREFSAGVGEYLLVMQGNGATDLNYKLRIVTPEFTTAALTLGNTVTGSISEKGEQDTYTFTGTAGQQLFYDALASESFRVRMYDPTGREIFNADSRNDVGTNGGLVLSMNGTYKVVIGSDGEGTGNYSFRFLDKAAAPVVNLDTDITGTLDNSIGSRLYRFNITGGSKYLYIDGQAGTYYNNWIIYAPNGQYITSTYIYDDREFSAGVGEYLLVMQGNGATDLNYKLRIVTPEFTTAALTLGNTVTGSISEKGEQDTYTFTGTAGQQLFYDALASESFRVRMYDPTGREIFNADSRNDVGTNGGLVLSMNGTYKVVIGSDGEGTGNYSFRFLDKAAAPVVNLDTDITGTLDNSIGSRLYRFNITGGSKYLYIDGQAGTYYNNWIIYAPNGQYITSTYIYDDREFSAGVGEYLLVMQGNGATDLNYKLRIVTPEFTTAALTLGNTVTGSISEKGEQDTYTFTGTAGQQLFYDALGGDYFRLQLFDPTGREIYNADSRNDRGTNDGLVLSMNGTYKLVVDGNVSYGNGEATGNYNFRLLDKAVATPVIFNTDTSGTFDSAGIGSKLYRFNAQAGQHFYLDTAIGQYPNSWIIYGTGGQYIGSGYLQEGYSNNDYEFDVPTTGEYLLVMQGNGAANTNYKFYLTSPQFDYANLPLGSLVSGNIATRGEQDIYTFAGTVGQQIFLDAIATNPNLKAKLYSPTNVLVADRDINSDWSPVNLGEDGTYRLIIDGVGTTTGNYSFIVSDRTAAPTLTLSNTITGSLTPGNQTDLYQFNGKQGQILNFDLNAVTWVGANWTFYDPSGKAIKTPVANSPDFKATLAADGIYTLAIAGNSTTSVNYSFIVTDNSTTPVTNSGLGTLQTGTLNTGQVIDYNFTATAGTKILFDSLDNNYNNWQIRARLIKPDGTYVFSDYDTHYDSDPILLEQTGDYKLQIFGYYNTTIGSYKFKLLELANGLKPGVNYLELGGVVAGSLNNLEEKIYTFNGTNGLRLMFNSMTGDNNVNAVVYDPNGNIVSSVSSLYWNADSNPYTLTQPGWYSLVLRNQQNTASNFSFQLLELDAAPEISFNLPNTFSLPSGQQSQVYKVKAKAGERLYFDVISTNGIDGNSLWKLYGVGNNLLFDQYQGSNAEVVIPYTGEYNLLIQGSYNTNKIDSSFQVTRHSTTTRDIIIPSNGKSSGGGEGTLGLFNVKLAAKDPAGATAIQDYQIRVVPDPENGNPVIISTPQTKYGLDQEAYRYQLKSVDPDNDALFYRLVDAPLGASINGDTGELLWFPTSGVKNGDKATFKVEVSDRRGGYDRQNFEVQVYGALGKIQGAVFDDLNSNGIRDTKLFSGDNPIVVFAVDTSGSTAAPFYGKGQYKNVKTVLDAQVQAVLTFMDAVVAQGLGDKLKIGLLPFTNTAVIQDMDLVTPGTQPYTTALADKNNNGIADIKEILKTYTSNGSSRFTPVLETIDTLLGTVSGNPNLIFMSDGYGALDAVKAAQVAADIKARGGSVTAFAIGQYATVETLDKVDPNALQVLEFDELFDIFSGFDPRYATEPLKENVSVYLDLNNNGVLDSGEPVQITQKDTSESTLGTTKYQFTFDGLEPETYTVREVVPSGYVQTLPSSNKGWTDTVTTVGEKFIHLFGVGKVREPANEDPFFITNPADLTQLKAGQTLLYRANAVDPNADPVTYSLVLAPKGATVDAKTGTVVWTPTKAQVDQFYKELKENKARLDAIGRGYAAETTAKFNILLTANDGRGGKALQYVNVEVLADNNAPIFTSTLPADTQPQVGKVFQYQATATDPDGDAISFALVNAPTGVTITNDGLLKWTPVASQLGDRTFQIQVKDNKGGEALQTIKATVVNPQPNRLPTITSVPRTSARPSTPYFYEIIASDPDGDSLTYTLTTKPEGLTIKDNVITWNPQPQQSGANNVKLRVSDSQGGFIEQSFSINVTNQITNRPPAITSAPNLVTNLQKQYQYNLTGNDPDNDQLFWSLDQAPDGMVIDTNTGALRWQPKATQIGDFAVAIRLTDNYGAYTVQEYSLKATGVNTPPQILSTPITKAAQNQAYTYQVVANDPENEPLTYSLGAKPTGMVIDGKTGLIQWTATSNQTGSQQIEVIVRDAQGAASQQTYTLQVVTTAINHAPTITSTPSFFATVGGAEPYKYQVQATDTDAGDIITYKLLEAPTGMIINASSGLLNWANPVAGNYQVVVAAFDNQGLGVTQGYTLAAKVNSLPIIRSTAPRTDATPGVTYRYDIQANDPDGGTLTYTLDTESQKRGITVDSLGRLSWTPTANQVGTYPVIVTISDNAGGKVTQNFNLTVAADTTAPQINLIRSTNIANKGDEIFFQVKATDNIGIANLQLLIDNKPVLVDANGIARLTTTSLGTISAKAIATDLAGNNAQATTIVLILDPTDTEAPTVKLDLSTIPDTITAPIDIRGQVSDSNLLYYTLEVAPVDGSAPFKEVFRGTQAVIDGVLGKFDPSVLPNDTYVLRLTAYDAGNHQSSVQTTSSITGNFKLGNFQVSFTDLEIPVNGIPIILTRTYDTFNSNTKDDFGYGWRMEFRDTDLRTNLPKDELYEEIGIRTIGFDAGTQVYITLPGRKRERFTFQPRGYLLPGLYQPGFVADKGVASTLTVASSVLIKGTNDQFYGFNGGAYNPADTDYGFGGYYILTTKEGIVYQINAQTGDIDKITDTNGNQLTFTDGGISSSTGQKITFERNNYGQIATVTDPLGKVIRYEYDTQGNLVTVTDRENNKTQFEYKNEQPHYLDKIIDPLKRVGVKNEYDEQGRLVKLIDAAGNPVQFVYDPENSLQTIKDGLGNPTTYEYDSRGNIVREVDALGGLTQRTFDERNNLLTETDSEGHKTTYTYDISGNVLTKVDALGNISRYTYNSFNKPLTETDPLGNTSTYTYDSRGNLLSKTDAAGHLTQLKYDQGGQLLSVTDAGGNLISFEYDRFGHVTRQVDTLGNATTYTYDSNGNELTETSLVSTSSGLRTLVTTKTYNANGLITSITDPEGHKTQTEYDALSHKTVKIDALNRRTEYKYDDKGQLIEVIYADKTSEKITYDAAGHQIAKTDRGDRTTRFTYDALGRLIATIYPDATPDDLTDNPRTRLEYNKIGKVVAQIDERNNRTQYTYDAAGQIISIRDALGNETRYTYDAVGHQISQTDALNHTTKYSYDAINNLVQTSFADGTSIVDTYDILGHKTATTDQAGFTTRYEYDVLGRLTAVVDPLKGRTVYGYDEPVYAYDEEGAGNLIRQTDANGHTTTYEYDALGHRLATVKPLGQRASFTYDPVGNLLSNTDFNGKTITYQYDSNNRLIKEQFSDNTNVSYTYTPTGKIASITDSNGVTKYIYDARDHLLTVSESDGQQIQYTYDLAGNRTAVITSSNTTSYTYDALNRLSTVISPDFKTTKYTYDAVSNLIKTELPNNIVETRAYDSLNRLISLENVGASGLISSYHYTLDAVGDRTLVEESGGRKVHYIYDASHRLTQEEITNPSSSTRTIKYTYDPVGNRLSRNDSVAGLSIYTYDHNDQLLTEVVGNQTTQYTYDNNGNTLSRIKNATDKATYHWDDQNRLISADVITTTGTHHSEYRYNSSGIRIGSVVDGKETRYLVDTNRPYAEVIEEYTPDKTTIASYVYGHDLISQTGNNQQSFYLYDGHSGVRLLTNTTGVVTDTYTYDAYGNLLQSTGTTQNSYLYQGEQNDSNLNWQYLRARYYNPNLGRFTSVDPFEGLLVSPISLNKYLYAHANPLTFVDPSGQTPLTDFLRLALRFGLLSPFQALPWIFGSIAHRAIQADILLQFPPPQGLVEVPIPGGRIDVFILPNNVYEIKPLGGVVDPNEQLDRYTSGVITGGALAGLLLVRGSYPFNSTINIPLIVGISLHYYLEEPGIILYDPFINSTGIAIFVATVATIAISSIELDFSIAGLTASLGFAF
ncbi:putative Ig domain-containing protein [Nostoc sp. MS1]|uniref:putative Ig domain-containing protein n=1 Tax=Nostoc sp. MS1 TaxID=2764711 RepID=UPI001CC818EE|nr:putative Ig domain-containing protein [Nostoc sp. MS1]BCL38132.1 hypothetical protein NSMS1_45790 [Nostoc sp. MS1]